MLALAWRAPKLSRLLIDQYTGEGRRYHKTRLIERDPSSRAATYSAIGLIYKAMGASDADIEDRSWLDGVPLNFYLEHTGDAVRSWNEFRGFKESIESRCERGMTPLEIAWWLDQNFGA
jgi:hypothetical protein